jgi:hypothetical protein
MIDQVIAHHLFEYKDGDLYWKNAQRPSFNGKKAGYDNGSGYKKVSIDGKQYYSHRIIYLMQHGVMPKLVDHIDGNPSNNAIENLRPANTSQNMMNSLKKQNNTSGYRNVFPNKERDTWVVYITINKKTKFFGSYEDVELAGLVAEEARRKYHGEFFSTRSIN